jgi:hypothetical protein
MDDAAIDRESVGGRLDLEPSAFGIAHIRRS